MNRSENDTRTDDKQHQTHGTVAGTIFGWVFRTHSPKEHNTTREAQQAQNAGESDAQPIHEPGRDK